MSGLTIGDLTLSPAFDPDTTTYTAKTANYKDVVTAVAADKNATVDISVGVTPIDSGDEADWSDGVNTLTVVVTNGSKSTTYTVTVAVADATLSGLTIGNLTLNPSFHYNQSHYSVETPNASNKVTATPAVQDAQITILWYGTDAETGDRVDLGEVQNGESVTWDWNSATNYLDINVVNGPAHTSYVVTVIQAGQGD